MKNDIKKLYKKDKVLATKVAKVLGYKIKVISKSKKTLDEVINSIIDYTAKDTFNRISKIANSDGYVLKLSAKDFEKYLKSMLVSKLK